MNKQLIFNKVASHILKQEKQSKGPQFCMYRTADNNKCAIGCLIPDEKYEEAMDDLTKLQLRYQSDEVGTSISENPLVQDVLRKEYGVLNIGFLTSLQNIHDKSTNWCNKKKEMKIELRELAEREELDYSVITP